MSLPPILVIKTGSPLPAISERYGGYELWFAAGLEEGASRCLVADATEELPDPSSFGGVILTGSLSSVRDEEPWMERLASWSLLAAERGTQILAVCFGHQLLGEALGGRVEPMEAGPEMGAVEVRLTPEGEADPLFAGLPSTLIVNQTHFDGLVVPPPPGRAVRLAGNDRCPWQAYRVGSNVRGVQFHPELRDETLAALLAVRGIEGSIRPSGHGAAVLRNWDERFVRRSDPKEEGGVGDSSSASSHQEGPPPMEGPA